MTTLTEHPSTEFTAPTETFAPAPAEYRGLARDEVRLLVARPTGVTHARFHDLPDQLGPGDLLVVNNSATIAGEADAVSDRRGPVVLHVAMRLDDDARVVEVRSAPDAARPVLDAEAGEVIGLGEELAVRLIEPYPRAASSPTGLGNRLWRAQVEGADGDGAVMERYLRWNGRPIGYGYLDRRYPLESYQTVFGTIPGSAEMPSAGRPFTNDLITRLAAGGVATVPITLHTGVSSQEVGESPQTEWFDVPEASARLVNAVRAGGGRVVAVGTTVTRALESAVDTEGRVRARSGWTDRVVTPADPPRVVTGLITGWHDPQASHLLLVEAVAGPGITQAAYDAAVSGGYLWHEFGDSALLLP